MPANLDIKIDRTSFAEVSAVLKAGEDAVGLKALKAEAVKEAKSLRAAMQAAIKGAQVKGSTGGGANQRMRLTEAGQFKTERARASAAKRSRGLRASIARTVNYRTFTSRGKARRSSSIVVRADASKMPGGEKGPLRKMGKHWNYGGWRHPVFAIRSQGNGSWPGAWVQQNVSPGWFDGTWAKARDRAQAKIMNAAADAYDVNKMKRAGGSL